MKIDTNEIPEIKTPCPANSNRHVSVKNTCTKCRFFKAVACANPDERLTWSERHRIVCQLPRNLPVVDEVNTEDALKKVESLTVSKLIDES